MSKGPQAAWQATQHHRGTNNAAACMGGSYRATTREPNCGAEALNLAVVAILN